MEVEKTRSLSLEKLPTDELPLSNFKIVICDIDYTLVDFDQAHEAGMGAIGAVMGQEFAREVAKCFHLTLHGHRMTTERDWPDRAEYEGLQEKTKSLYESFSSVHGHKVWSREAWIILTADKLKMKITKVQVEHLRDAYWNAVAKNSPLYEDAKYFLATLEKDQAALVLMTGSDSILQISDDLSVMYEPKFSEEYKKRRVEKMNLHAREVIIGDPIDKPDPRYFEKVFGQVMRISDAKKNEILFVGDSLRNDLEVPASLGYKTLLVIRD